MPLPREGEGGAVPSPTILWGPYNNMKGGRVGVSLYYTCLPRQGLFSWATLLINLTYAGPTACAFTCTMLRIESPIGPPDLYLNKPTHGNRPLREGDTPLIYTEHGGVGFN